MSHEKESSGHERGLKKDRRLLSGSFNDQFTTVAAKEATTAYFSTYKEDIVPVCEKAKSIKYFLKLVQTAKKKSADQA